MMDDALIEARGLTINRPGTSEPVLSRVDFRIRPGEIVTVVGPNGSGKSSLIRALLGQMALAGGTVDRRRDLRIGYVPQRVQLDTAIPMTVRRFLSLPRRVTDAQAQEALDRTGGNVPEAAKLLNIGRATLYRKIDEYEIVR